MNTPKVVPLHRRVNADCVQTIEDLLVMAKDGRLQDIAACGVTSDGATITSISASENAVLRLAAITRLLHRQQVSIDAASTVEEP